MSFNITIYTDGAAKGNPGPGGFGAVMLAGPHRKEISQGFRLTTNNRMELLSVIVALESVRQLSSTITVVSDSRYVVDTVEKGWLFTWMKNGFKGKKNADLWQRFYQVFRQHKVKFVWIKGHAGHPENERCDRLAVAAAEGRDLAEDTGYLLSLRETEGLF